MTSDKDRDKELIEKVGATNTVKHLFGQGAMAVCAAINTLEPVKNPDRSEEEIIRKIKAFLSYAYWPDDKFRMEIHKLFSAPDPADKKGGTGD